MPAPTDPPSSRPRLAQFVTIAPAPSLFRPSSSAGVASTYPIVEPSMLEARSEVCRCRQCGHAGFTELKLVPNSNTYTSALPRDPLPGPLAPLPPTTSRAMADDPGEYDFDLELYCIVCDRQIDPTSASAVPTDSHRSPRRQSASGSAPAPAPSPSLHLATSVNTSPAPPNPTPSSHPRAPPPAGAPKLKRSGSGHSAAATSTHAAGTGGGLKRNKSLGRVGGHHHPHHRKNHSHANLHALAPMTGGAKKVPVTAVGPAAAAERDKGKGRDRDKERENDVALVVSTLYCSEECKRIDEARNQLALAHLGGSDSPIPAPFPLPSPNSDVFDPDEEPHASMIRRRSSGVSSVGSTSYAFSSTGERGLSPIMSAAPTSNPTPYLDSSGFPFPSVSSSSSPFTARGSPQNAMTSHPSNSSLNSLPSQQAAPVLNFSSRRQSRGAHSSGAYSYRPSLMERVHSTDSQDSNASERGASRTARSLSIGGGGLSAGLFNRVRSMDGLAMMGRSDSESSDREGRQGQNHRPPSALSSLRSMTPISNGTPLSSSGRPRPPLANMRYSEPTSSSHQGIEERPPTTRIASDSLASSESRSRSRSRKPPQAGRLPSRTRSRPPPTTSPLHGGSDPPEPVVGSLPAPRSRGLSLGSPTLTTSLLRPVPVAPDSVLANRRASSSASLALLGSSVSKSYDHRSGGPLAAWTGLRRTDSTAGLSGLNAVGEMSAPSSSLSSLPPSSSSTASTFIPAPSTYQPRPPSSPAATTASRHHAPHDRPRRPSSSHSHPHSSPSSATSSFGPSQSSVRTSSSSRRSTAASSDHHWQGVMSSSYGSAAGKPPPPASSASTAMHRTRSGSSTRPPDRPSTGTSSTSSTGLGGGGGGTGAGATTNSNRIKQGGLTMTPSWTNLTHHATAAAAAAPPSPTPRTHSALAPAVPAAGPPGGGLAAAVAPAASGGGGARTWSWTNLHVPTYQALDVSEYRANKERTAAIPTGTGPGLSTDAAAVPPKKDRKRLFYFSEQND
ncbi:hypothetical protein JCM11491_006115 [Sporobolomyces phaffii]